MIITSNTYAPDKMNEFLQVEQLIQTARNRALSTVNNELVNLYWQVGQYVSQQLEKARWGEGMAAYFDTIR